MKKLLALTPVAALFTFVATSDVNAQINPSVLQHLRTKVAGTIAVPAPPTGNLAGFGCGNITMTATSKEYLAPPPGGIFGAPKWTRSAVATGTYGSGSCSYSIPVPHNSDFYLTASGSGNFTCHVVSTWLGAQGYPVGPIKAPLAGTKTQNLSISKVSCDFIH